MKKNFLLLLLLNACMHIYAQTDVASAKWMHVTIDGSNKEWGALNFYDDQTQLNFGIANDSDNIYLCFATINEPVQMKLMRAGMKLTLSTKGKSRHEASILFPLPQPKQPQLNDSLHNEDNGSSEHHVFNKETFRQYFIAHHATMQVSGFSAANGIVPVKDTGLQAAVNWDSASNLIYEVAIAKKEFFGTNYTAKDAMDDIMLSVEVNALPHSALGDERSGGYKSDTHDEDGGSGSAGMHHNGGTHGVGFNGHNNNEDERSPAGNTDFTSLSTKTSFKQKFVLNNGSNLNK